METLIDEYENSELAAFHQRFYGEPCQQPPYSVDAGSVRIAGAPPCVEWLLDHPNDWLLKPAALQHVARVLTALEWPPLAIAHLICGSTTRMPTGAIFGRVSIPAIGRFFTHGCLPA